MNNVGSVSRFTPVSAMRVLLFAEQTARGTSGRLISNDERRLRTQSRKMWRINEQARGEGGGTRDGYAGGRAEKEAQILAQIRRETVKFEASDESFYSCIII